VDGVRVEHLAGDHARIALPARLWRRAVQTGGPGSLWQLVLVPPSVEPSSLLLAVTRPTGATFSVTSELFAGQGPREALLRCLTSPAPVWPARLWEAATEGGRLLRDSHDPFERRLLLALSGLLALRFNLTVAAVGVTAASAALEEAVFQGRKDLGDVHRQGPSDLLVVAAWTELLSAGRPDAALARELLLEASRTLPAFAYGLELLTGGLGLLEPDADVEAARGRLRPFAEAAVPARGYTSYYGRAPGAPAIEPLLGEPSDDGGPVLTLQFPRGG
jgi:hypothetical protein